MNATQKRPPKQRPTREDHARKILAVLRTRYAKAHCALHHRNAFELLMATILSAQCTDDRVNGVTPALFSRWPTPEKLSQASEEDVSQVIRSTGFFRSKAQALVESSRRMVESFGGNVPPTMEDLLTLRGVARKTANVVLGNAFGLASGIVVDTHVMRLAQRLGLSREKDPVKIERDLMEVVPLKKWIWFSHALIAHGRRLCRARQPLCERCPLNKLCPAAR